MIKKKEIEGLDASYYGGKSGTGTYQSIINELPMHKFYVELFLGAGAILRYKKASEAMMAFDKDEKIIEKFKKAYRTNQFFASCGIKFLETLINDPYCFMEYLPSEVLIYIDAPYLLDARKEQKKVYKNELSFTDHQKLLTLVKQLKYNVAISHYPHELYESELSNWRQIPYKSVTRSGIANEILFMNYDQPTELHDYRFLGKDYRERERIRRKVKRHVNRLEQLPILERNAILNALRELQ